MKTKLLLLCLFLVGALVMSGCTGLASGARDDRTTAVAPSVPETPEAIPANSEDISGEEQGTNAPTEEISTDTDNTSGMEQGIKEPTEAAPANSDNISGMERIRALTDQEKADLIAIASQHPSVSDFINSGYEYGIGFQWIGLLPSGGYGVLPYDTVEKGVPTSLEWSKMATFYPALSFHFGTYAVLVAVDLDKREVVYSTSGPTFKGPVSRE